MRTAKLKLGNILDIPKWQVLQDSLAEVTGLAIITIDYKGIPISKHSGRRAFCSYVRENPELIGFCHKCDSRAGLEAVRIGKPYIYLCHCQIVDVAIPIVVDDKYIGAVMAGEIKLNDKSEEENLEKILTSPAERLFSTTAIKDLYNNIPTMSLARLNISVQMLFDLCNYIVEEALNKNLLLELYEKVLTDQNVGNLPEGHSLKAVENIRKDLGEAITNAYIKINEEEAVCSDRVLQPAFDYIYQHKGTILSQKDAAEMCHISTGHFCRLFSKETGENFSNYYSRLKVEWAKQMLEKTDIPIARISEELGFSEAGYFIKTFRKYEGITPAYYRKHIKSEKK